jgi:hypothetical protein
MRSLIKAFLHSVFSGSTSDRKMKNGGPYKPYAIIDDYTFSATEALLQKGTPL